MKKREEKKHTKKQALITLSTSTLFAVCIKRVKGNCTRKTNKNLCLVIFVNSQEPDQGQPCLHKKFENKKKNVKNFQLKFVVFTALKITVYCIGVFANIR